MDEFLDEFIDNNVSRFLEKNRKYVNFCGLRSLRAYGIGRSPQTLSRGYLSAAIGVDTTENELCKVLDRTLSSRAWTEAHQVMNETESK